MNSIILNYFEQFIPVLLGIAFVIFIKSIAVGEYRVVIRTSGRVKCASVNQPGSGIGSYRFDSGLPVPISQFDESEHTAAVLATWNFTSMKGDFRMWKKHMGTSENMRNGLFERKAYDALITNGLLGGKKVDVNIRKYACKKLNFVDIATLAKLGNDLRLPRYRRLTLFASDRKELIMDLIRFGGFSGVLIQYLAGYAVDIEMV